MDLIDPRVKGIPLFPALRFDSCQRLVQQRPGNAFQNRNNLIFFGLGQYSIFSFSSALNWIKANNKQVTQSCAGRRMAKNTSGSPKGDLVKPTVLFQTMSELCGGNLDA